MKWCLAEGHRKIDLSFLSRPKVLAVMQDVRAAKLLMRFKATDSKLKTRRGVMGAKAVPNGSALKLKEASLMIIARACTKLAHAPWRPKRAPPPNFKRKVFKRTCNDLEQFTADAAADEQLAGQLLRERPVDPATVPGSAAQTYAVMAPNLKIVDRDKSHSFRRVTTLPWRAHPR